MTVTLQLDFCTVDVFTSTPFAGNPLAIVLDADGLTTNQMQTIAREFNLSETIFVQTPDDKANTAKVRIFFPTDEIPFAGHPTIGCAIYLAEQQFDADEDFVTEIKLEEVAGLVPVKIVRKNGNISAQLTAPIIPFENPTTLPNQTDAAKALGLNVSEVGIKDHAIGSHQGGPSFLYIPLAGKEALSKASICEPFCSQIITQAKAGGLYAYWLDVQNNQIHGRMFDPLSGIMEDPATGSASAILASQLLNSGVLNEGQNEFSLFQGYDMGRPSNIDLEIDVSNGKIQAVRVAGSAVFISSGKISIPTK